MNTVIRNYRSEDANDIGKISFLNQVSYQYNKDFIAQNIFCAELNGRIVACGHLEPTDSCEYLNKQGRDDDYKHRFIIDTDSDENEPLETEIFNSILLRANEIRQEYSSKQIQISKTCSHDDLESIDFLLSNGFYHSLNYLIMKRDLTKPLPDYSLHNKIEIKRWTMDTESDKELYLQAEKDASEGESWSKAKLNWFKSGPQWDTFTAFYQGKPISSCMTWGISSERSATEQIFTHPMWRRQGVAKRTIVEALRFLRDEKDKKEATLGVVGSNQAAINLYKSLGYKLIDIHLLMVKDIM
ncbi:GNAT family N-acetyltransferase [Paenibacillus sp. N3.4]|uniref:GNAT family N-acetyltransferase n=1 Tax=Paenibacillus sp. N3.4 TaxID=2603222 RepID=UPI0011CA76DE|nr:GNAT family N-acetyltransferase [Paenibacillus sp. N3.4]TXK80675.1 GNAT family N-acetyltransferase [Paenibacillus sp. N3.4]